MIADERIAEVVSRLTGVPKDELKLGIPPGLPLLDSADSLDTTELIMELEEEFDKETVKWALRYTQVLAARAQATQQAKRPFPPRPEGLHPLWDRNIDG
jgi:acyl carrier protein